MSLILIFETLNATFFRSPQKRKLGPTIDPIRNAKQPCIKHEVGYTIPHSSQPSAQSAVTNHHPGGMTPSVTKTTIMSSSTAPVTGMVVGSSTAGSSQNSLAKANNVSTRETVKTKTNLGNLLGKRDITSEDIIDLTDEDEDLDIKPNLDMLKAKRMCTDLADQGKNGGGANNGDDDLKPDKTQLDASMALKDGERFDFVCA